MYANETRDFWSISSGARFQRAETAWVEGEEKLQESLGVDSERSDEEDPRGQGETDKEAEERQEMYRTTYLNRKRAENDTRSDADIRAELQSLLTHWDDTELWKTTSPSFGRLLSTTMETGEFSKEGRSDLDAHSAKIKWLNGMDLE